MALSFTAVALAPESALAGVKVAIPCDKDPLHCARAPINFSHVDALPIEWDFDTGWQPQNSPLQVHIWAGVYANTRISLNGAYVTSWEAEEAGLLALQTPGDPLGGFLSYHYGAELGAQGAVHVTILGQQYDWVGDLPYVPQFDFQVEAKGEFDAWAFPPGYSLASKTPQQKLAQISIADIIGASIPGIDGGFELDVAMELTATYTTTQIVMTEKEKPVLGGPITSEDGMSNMSYSGGPFTEVAVHPEGLVDYDGTLHLIPAFYIELLGQNWSIPIADIPIAFPITQTQWSFDPVTVHTPLPDLFLPVTEIDFGKVEVGQKNLEALELSNLGEAKLALAVTGETEAFEIFEPALEIDANKTIESAFRFVPKHAGEFKTTVLLSSNDPDKPLQEVILKGIGVDGPPLLIETDPPHETEDVELEGACACRAGGGGSDAGGVALLAIGMAVTAARSRRRWG
jgi:hypothetical protein